MSAADPIPAVREQDATGEVAQTFADLRVTLGVPFVNLIWRHLATIPGMLGWAWAVVKPLHGTGLLPGLAQALRQGVQMPPGIGQPACVLDAVGVTAADRRVIGVMLRHYNAANAMNLLCLLTVQSILEGGVPGGQVLTASSPAAPEPDSADLPRLPGLAELPPPVRALALALDEFGRLAPTDAVASLYRHLGHWPGFLAVAHATLSIPHHGGVLRAEHERTNRRARAIASERLMPLAPALPVPAAPDAQAARRSLNMFTTHMIGRMTTLGEVMLALLPGA